MQTIRRITSPTLAERKALHALLRDSVQHGASVGYLLPLPETTLEDFWNDMFAQVQRGERILLVAGDSDDIAGSVQLSLCMKPNARHRAEVQKLLVHSSHRRQGLALRLMEAIEDEATKSSLTLLTLDTETGSAAETLYDRLGYRRVGIVPRYAGLPSGELRHCTFFYRELVEPDPQSES